MVNKKDTGSTGNSESSSEVGYVDFNVIPYEYECGSYCTPTGCHGHYDNNVLTGFEINGEIFLVEGIENEDYPDDIKPEQIEKINNLIKMIQSKVAT